MTANTRSVDASPAPHYVLPSPPRRIAGEGPGAAPPRDPEADFRRGEETARQLGDRLALLCEHQELLLGELRERLVALDAEIVDAPRARCRGALREALAVLDWADAAQQDLVRESRLAQGGAEPIDVAALCRDVARRVAVGDQPIYVTGEARATVWGRAPAIACLVREALTVVADRTQGRGARSIDVFEEQGEVRLAIRSTGIPAAPVAAESVARFHRACERAGAVSRPDETGGVASALVLALPGQPPA
jgi:hypothetical protein